MEYMEHILSVHMPIRLAILDARVEKWKKILTEANALLITPRKSVNSVRMREKLGTKWVDAVEDAEVADVVAVDVVAVAVAAVVAVAADAITVAEAAVVAGGVAAKQVDPLKLYK
nr:hypothetical protein HmN_000226800 [Hymenolepis microstoma]